MSLSKPRPAGLKNPADLFIEWKGGRTQGIFQHYVKGDEKGKGENVEIDLGEGIFVLDNDLFSVTGYNDNTKERYISNEVRSIEDRLVIKAYKDGKSRVFMEGTYSSMKEAIKGNRDLKYTKCIYAMTKDGRLAHLKMHGLACAGWLNDVQSSSALTEKWVLHVDTKDGTKGQAEFKYPVFAFGENISEEDFEKALNLDKEKVQPYLEKYLAAGQSGNAPANDPAVSTDWRKFVLHDGTKLSDYSLDQIEGFAQMAAEEGDEGPAYEAIKQAMTDYATAIQTWKQKKDKSGKSLSEYTYDEIMAVIEKVPRTHPSFLFLDAAQMELAPPKTTHELAAEAEEEDDEIPF